MNKLFVGYIGLAMSILSWFIIVVIGKMVANDFPKPLFTRVIGTLCYIIWGIPYLIYRYFYLSPENRAPVTKRDVLNKFSVGIVQMGHAIFYVACLIYFTNLSHTAIHMGAPIIIFSVGLIFGWEKFEMKKFIAIITLLTGICLMVGASFLQPDVNASSKNLNMLVGSALIFVSTTLLAAYTIAINKANESDERFSRNYYLEYGKELPKDNQYLGAMRFLATSGVTCLPVVICITMAAHFIGSEPFEVPTSRQFLMIFISTFSSSIYMLSFTLALSSVSPLTVSMSQPLVIPICAAFDFFYSDIKEHFTAYIGMIVICSAVVLIAIVESNSAKRTLDEVKTEEELEQAFFPIEDAKALEESPSGEVKARKTVQV
eukprot:GDKJ01016991.1.p1 GENE.GDKJ01016991.1~~GDKJ01016991.1.p1  ORF type:complete len:381 (-),score=71.18 GDKJ01016991.1:247-1368(-)